MTNAAPPASPSSSREFEIRPATFSCLFAASVLVGCTLGSVESCNCPVVTGTPADCRIAVTV
jgi:hypothetical protein